MGVSKAPDAIRSVHEALAAFLEETPSDAFTLALSGGMDSMVLLHALTELHIPFNAVHVHHGLSRHADAWAAFCQQQARLRGVPCHVEHVTVHAGKRGIEAAARKLRYAALMRHVPEGGCLLTAHHQRDQAETVLLNLLRGSGVRGLQGMRPLASQDGKWVGRPLLQLPYGILRTYACHFDLAWMEDGSNRHGRFLRNRIRFTLLPLLRRLQPAVERQLAATAAHHQAAEQLLERYAARLLEQVQAGKALDVEALLALDSLDRGHVLRHWFLQEHGLVLTQTHLQALDALLSAKPDRCPEVKIGEKLARRFQNRLIYPACEPPEWAPLSWEARKRCPFEISGELACSEEIRLAPFMTTGLKIKPYKKAFQEAGIPPWLRARWPVLMRGNRPLYILNVGVVKGVDVPVECERLKAAFHC